MAAKKKIGRGQVYKTEARMAAILAAIRQGCSNDVAALAAGVGHTTFYNWRRDPAFAERLKKAAADFEKTLVQRIAKASIKDWKAASHLLAVRFPERWAPAAQRLRVEVSAKYENMTPAEVESRKRELLLELSRAPQLLPANLEGQDEDEPE